MFFAIRNNIVLLLFLSSSTFVFPQIYNTQVEAKLNLKSNTDYIEIIGSAFNKTQINQSLRYQLSVFKNDNNNTNISNNKQEGRIVLASGQKKNVSTVTINANEKDRIIILLLIYNLEDQLLGKHRVILNENEDDKVIVIEKKNSTVDIDKQVENDGVVLRGIVVEETKTKLGRDFYKMFYSLYLGYNVNGEKIVIVKEKLALANNTKIEIFVHNDKVFEFFLRPQNEYLKVMSEESLKKVYLHLQKLKQNKNRVQHY